MVLPTVDWVIPYQWTWDLHPQTCPSQPNVDNHLLWFSSPEILDVFNWQLNWCHSFWVNQGGGSFAPLPYLVSFSLSLFQAEYAYLTSLSFKLSALWLYTFTGCWTDMLAHIYTTNNQDAKGKDSWKYEVNLRYRMRACILKSTFIELFWLLNFWKLHLFEFYVETHTCHCTHTEVRGQLLGMCFLFPFRGFLLATALATEQSCQLW